MIEQNIKKLGELCDFVRGPFGGSLKKNCFKEDGYAVYEQQHAIYNQFDEIRYFIDEDKFEEMKRFELKSGDLIMSCSGTMGKVAIVPDGVKQGIINQALLKLTPNLNLDVEYLRYWMQGPSFTEGLEKHTVGAAIKNVASVKILKTIELPAPTLTEQKQIVAILDKAFAAIDQAKANIEKNIQNAKELFQSKLNEIFSQKGDGWEEVMLKDIIDVKHGFAFKSKFFRPEGDFVLLTPGNYYEEGGYRDRGEKQKYYVGEIPEGYILEKDDLLVAMTEQAAGLLGSPLLVPESGKFLHNQRLGLVKIKDRVNLSTRFLYHVFNKKKFRKEIHHTGTGLKVRHTSPTKISEIEVSVHYDSDIQNKVIDTLIHLEKSSNEMILKYRSKIQSLNELKKSILQKAFAGELTA